MKTILVSVSIVLCASVFTSCRSDYERAYEAECNYRLAKKGLMYEVSDTTKFKNKFEALYESMDVVQRENYRSFREEQKRMEKEFISEFRQTEHEINSMLND